LKLRHASAPLAIACLSLVFPLIALSGCHKGDAGGADADAGATVAKVNGQPISQREFTDFLIGKTTVLVQGQQGAQQAPTVGSVGLQALRDMVDRTLMLQLAKDEGVLPTDADVQKELDFRNASQPGYSDSVLKEGIPMDELKDQIKFDLARERLITKGVTVPMTEVDQYIKENPKQFTEPATDDLLLIALKTPANESKVDAALKAGKPFKEVAAQYSEVPNAKQTGGALPKTPLANLPQPVQSALAKVSPLHATDWINVGSGYLKLYVLSKSPEKKMELTAIKKEALQRSLAMQRGQATNDLSAKMLDKLKSANIDVSQPMLKKPWAQIAEEIKRTPATPPPGAAAGGAPGAGAPGAGAPKGATPPPGGAAPHF
jgi:parvulin-like peptidyl-prolyl isomerase